MPTDVLGHERLLEALIIASGLVYRGRVWRAASATTAVGETVSPAA